jgi:hypothetical protein
MTKEFQSLSTATISALVCLVTMYKIIILVTLSDYITGLTTDFCTIIDSQDAFIDQIFSNVHRQYTNHEWLAERAILVAKNVDVNELNLKTHLLPGDLVSYKSIDTVCDATETVNYST